MHHIHEAVKGLSIHLIWRSSCVVKKYDMKKTCLKVLCVLFNVLCHMFYSNDDVEMKWIDHPSIACWWLDVKPRCLDNDRVTS